MELARLLGEREIEAVRPAGVSGGGGAGLAGGWGPGGGQHGRVVLLASVEPHPDLERCGVR